MVGEQDVHTSLEAERLSIGELILSGGGGKLDTAVLQHVLSLKAVMRASSSKACFKAEADDREKTAIH